MPQQKKLIFFDIDGTLWDIKNHISESTKAAIKEASKNGHQLFVNSGRARGYINNPNLLSLGFDGIVGGCGTTIEYHDELIFSSFLSSDTIENALNILNGLGCNTILEGYEALYLDPDEWTNDMYIEKLKRELGKNLRSIRDNWGNWDKVCKLSSATQNCDINKDAIELKKDFDFIIHNVFVAEIVPKGFGKSYGIKRTCEFLNVDREDTYAFGDGSNDLDMIKYAGCGIAMGNGNEEIKSVADYVTDSIDNDGIYNAMKHFNLI